MPWAAPGKLQNPDQLPDARCIRDQNFKTPFFAGFHQFSAVNQDFFYIPLQQAQGFPINLMMRRADCRPGLRIFNKIQILVVDEPNKITILKSRCRQR